MNITGIRTCSEGWDDDSEEVHDPYCDPENPVKVPFQEVSAAAFMIKGGIERTPCDVSGCHNIKCCL